MVANFGLSYKRFTVVIYDSRVAKTTMVNANGHGDSGEKKRYIPPWQTTLDAAIQALQND